jgi:hypothetical protein
MARTLPLALTLLLASHALAVPARAAERLDDFQPSTRQGLFDAELAGGILKITLRVAFSFENGDPALAPGYADAEYAWTDAERTAFRQAFRQRVESAWSDRYVFRSTQKPDEVHVQLEVREVPERDDAQWVLRVAHYPDDAADLEASVCGPGESHYDTDCETNAEDLPWGTALMASTHLQEDYLGYAELAPLEVWYASGDDTPPDDLLSRPVLWSLKDPTWSVLMSGFAGHDEVASGARPGEVRPTVELARRRTARLRDTLIDFICSDTPRPAGRACRAEAEERLRVVNEGAYGSSAYAGSGVATLELVRGAKMDTLAHEAGHMLGLGDENTDDDWPEGSELASVDYAGLVLWYFGEVILRHDDDGIMSRGSVVEPYHYVTFLEALEELSGTAEWEVGER